jgi:hypothetical protein
VHAEFLVQHSTISSDTLKSRLIAKFKAEDRDALKNSPLFNSGKWDKIVLYSTETPGYRLLCIPTQDEESQIYVEPVKGNVIEICESVWRGTKRALSSSSPKLTSMKLVDDESGKDIMHAATRSFGQELSRGENISPVIVGVVAAIYAAAGVFTFASKDKGEFLAGAVTGLAGAVVALSLALAAARKGKLSWKLYAKSSRSWCRQDDRHIPGCELDCQLFAQPELARSPGRCRGPSIAAGRSSRD